MPPGLLPLLVFLVLLACIAVFGPLVDELIYKAEDQWYARHHSQSR